MKVRRSFPIALAALVLATGSFSSAVAAGGDDWRFKMPIGIWRFGIDGDITVDGIDREIDASASDVSDAIDKGAGISFEFGKGKWSGLFTASFLGFEEEDVQGTGPFGARADVTLDWTTVEFAGIYRAVLKNPGPKAFQFDVLGGVRFTGLTGEIEEVNGAFSGDRDVNWTDPLVGFRLVKSFTPHFAINVGGDAAGFGLSDNTSEMTINASAGVSWRWVYESGWSFALAAGYKLQSIDYEGGDDSRFTMDVDMTGPTVAGVFSW